MATSNLFEIVVLILVCMTVINNCSAITYHKTHPKFPAIIIFGDSSFDEKVVPDFLASFLGVKDAVPPFLDPNLSDDELPTGVSFASAESRFDNLTTLSSVIPISFSPEKHLIPVSKQVELFKSYIEKLKGIVGEDKAKNIIGEALVLISTRTNYLNFLDLPTSRRLKFDRKGYHDFLLQRLGNFVQELCDLGCRKIVVIDLPPIFCLSKEATMKFQVFPNTKCLEEHNSDAQSYSRRLAKLTLKIQSKLRGSKIVSADIYQLLISDMKNHPQHYGFEETDKDYYGCYDTKFWVTSLICRLFSDSVDRNREVYRYLANYFVKEVVLKLLHA